VPPTSSGNSGSDPGTSCTCPDHRLNTVGGRPENPATLGHTPNTTGRAAAVDRCGADTTALVSTALGQMMVPDKALSCHYVPANHPQFPWDITFTVGAVTGLPGMGTLAEAHQTRVAAVGATRC
jgi:hypothetical protein